MARKRRGSGEGGISRRKDGRWVARYYGADGRRKALYAKTRREVAEKLTAALASKDDASPPPFVPKNITVRSFFEEYEHVAKETMKFHSFETHKRMARNHLLPAFGGVRLADLTRERVQSLYTRKRDDDLSASTVRRIHGVLSAALNVAVKWRYVERNVCGQVSPPRMEQAEIRPFDLEETKRFLAAAEDGKQYHALYVLGVTTGARFGELTALQWRDLNLSHRTIRIERTLLRNGAFQTPKTRGSIRTVRLTVRACEALRWHRERQIAAGIPVEGDALVLTNGAGNPIHSSNFVRRSFKPLLRRAGLPDTTWHAATRHTCTCLLLLDRVDPKSICNQMGWSSVAFMLTNYARFMPGWGDDGAMDRILG